MTVCLTGDVHHMSLETRDQEYMDRTEVEAAIEYAEIAAEYDVPVTLFITGKCLEEEPNKVNKLSSMDNVEIGGHNFWAFSTLIHKFWRAIAKLTRERIGSWNGPKMYQSYEIQKSINIFAEKQINITSWRDHAYRYDSNTVPLLTEAGITHFSDTVGPDKTVCREGNLTKVPINTPPDHEHIYHTYLTQEYDEVRNFEGPFGSCAYEVDTWVEQILTLVRDTDASNAVTTILAHPTCMYLADQFKSFDELCQQLVAHRCVRMKQI